MKYVFGPVPSRRLGQSLGVDTIPLKTCNWNCVYCQLGRTVPLTNERTEYFPSADILAEVKAVLAGHRPGEIDWVTFVGSGEPTLHSGIGWLIQEVKAITNLPTRPPAETWVREPDEEGLMRARAILGDIATVVHPIEGEFDLSGYDTAIDAIIAIITRHPMRQEELERTLAHWTPNRVQEALAELEASGRVQVVQRYGARFWSAAPSRYPDEAHSLAAAPSQRRHRHGY